MRIVGYIFCGEFQCVDCCAGIDVEDCDPVFEDTEVDQWPVCAVCGEECREVELTQDGQDYYDAADNEDSDDDN